MNSNSQKSNTIQNCTPIKEKDFKNFLHRLKKASLENVLKIIGVYTGLKLSNDRMVVAKKRELKISQLELSQKQSGNITPKLIASPANSVKNEAEIDRENIELSSHLYRTVMKTKEKASEIEFNLY